MGRAVDSAPPGSTGSSMTAAARTTTSARWPTVSRPRSDSRAETAGSTQLRAQRAIEGQGLAPVRTRRAGRPARILAADGQGQAGPRVDGLDRRIRPERHDRAGVRDGTPRVALALGSLAPQPAARWPHPTRGGPAGRWPRCRARREATPVVGVEHLDVLDRGASAAWSRAPGARTSRAARTAASPMAWIIVVIPPAVARATRSARPSGLRHPHPAPHGRLRAAGPAPPRCPPAGPRSRDPSDPSAKHFCQPTRARPRGIVAERRAAASGRGRSPTRARRRGHGVDAERQVAGVGQADVDGDIEGQVGIRGHAAGIVAGDDAERDELCAPIDSIAAASTSSVGGGTWIVTRRAAASTSDALRLCRRRRGAPPHRSDRRQRSSPVPARRGWPTARDGRGPTARPGVRGRPSPGRRPSASDPSGRCPSRGPRATPRPAAPGGASGDGEAIGRGSRRRSGRPGGRAMAACARCRWASVRPGMATWSGSRAIRSRERVRARLEIHLGTGERDPSVPDADRLDPAEAGTPARVAMRPVISASSGIGRSG